MQFQTESILIDEQWHIKSNDYGISCIIDADRVGTLKSASKSIKSKAN